MCVSELTVRLSCETEGAECPTDKHILPFLMTGECKLFDCSYQHSIFQHIQKPYSQKQKIILETTNLAEILRIFTHKNLNTKSVQKGFLYYSPYYKALLLILIWPGTKLTKPWLSLVNKICKLYPPHLSCMIEFCL